MKPELKRFLEGTGIELSPSQVEDLEGFRELLYEVSEQLNLLSARDRDRIEELHLADSLAPAEMIPEGVSLADWGSGGGLPGIPLAIARPDIEVTLVESRTKKASFLLRVKRELSLSNVKIYADRGEDLKERFDVITVRAVGRLAVLVPEIARHVKPGGAMLFYKGPGLDAELDEAQELIKNFGITEKFVRLPRGEERRYILLSKR